MRTWALLARPAGLRTFIRCYTGSPGPAAVDEYTQAVTDLCRPASFYPTARALERRIVAHLGPTNSGKTHAALAALRSARSGLYAGPLRLLAWQVHDQLRAQGTPCNLVTGQERWEGGAAHTACTVEMASTRSPVEAAVLDEVQLVADAARGWAFTRALLGLPAATLHVCGDPAVLPLLERIVTESGDHLEVRRYKRLSPLAVARRPLAGLAQVQRGDCVVAFSRRDVHTLRHEIEAATPHRACVVYGALPPDARRMQAQLFDTPRSGFGVLAASDAVGMGLNLSIRRVVFSSLRKYDGVEERALTAAEIRQVAGRAGRYASRYPAGVVTALDAGDLAAVRQALEAPSEELAAARLLPSLAQLEALHARHPGDSLPALLRRFAEAAEGSLERTPHYRLARFDEQLALATMLRHLPLGLREAWAFSTAPAAPDDTPVAAALLGFAAAYASRRAVTPAAIMLPPLAQARSEVELQQLEAAHRVLDLYAWLAYRLPEAFVGAEEVAERRAALCALIDASIRAMGAAPRRRSQGRGVSSASAEEQALLRMRVQQELEQQQEHDWLQRKHSYQKHRQH